MEIAELEELREKELPLVQEVSFKIKELHQNVDELNKHQATLRTTIKQLKEKGKETDEKVWQLLSASLYWVNLFSLMWSIPLSHTSFKWILFIHNNITSFVIFMF